MIRINFIQDYEGMGGVENLILSLVKYYCSSIEFNVRCIIPTNSFLGSRLSGFKELDVIDTNQLDHLRAHQTYDDIFILFDLRFFKILKEPVKVLLWLVHPKTVLWHQDEFLNRAKLISCLEDSGSLYFMDEKIHAEVEKTVNSTLKKSVLPLPVKTFEIVNCDFKREQGTLNVSFVGRSVSEKLNTLAFFLSEADQYVRNNELLINVHLFTDDISSFKEFISRRAFSSKLVFFYYEGISGDDLSNNLIRVSDVHLGVGLGLLEGAKLAIPSLIINASQKELAQLPYKFMFFCHSPKYDIGDFIENRFYYKDAYLIGDLLKDIEDNIIDLKAIGNACLEKFRSEFLFDTNIELLSSAIRMVSTCKPHQHFSRKRSLISRVREIKRKILLQFQSQF